MNIKESLSKLDSLFRAFSWNGRELKNGKNYRAGGQTTISIYASGTDAPGSIEVAFEVNNLAKLNNRTVSDVGGWIKQLQDSVGAYATPKTQYQYPRVALSTDKQVDAFIDAFNAYLKEVNAQTSNKRSAKPSVDERILVSILSRRGQPAFRAKLLEAYDGKCAITGCETEAALEAAHIIPYAQEQSYETMRGILLRSDIHTLFDLLLISINPETGTVVIAPECEPSYSTFSAKTVAFPERVADRPDPASLMEHYGKWKDRNIG